MTFSLILYGEDFDVLTEVSSLSEEELPRALISNFERENVLFAEVRNANFLSPLGSSERLALVFADLTEKLAYWDIAAVSGWLAHDVYGGSRFAQYTSADEGNPPLVNESCLLVGVGSDSVLVRRTQAVTNAFQRLQEATSIDATQHSFSSIVNDAALTKVLSPKMAGSLERKASKGLNSKHRELSARELRSLPKVTLAVITRTQWKRRELLERNVQSVRALGRKSTGDFVVKHYIVSDAEAPHWWTDATLKVYVSDHQHQADSRSHLIAFSLKKIEDADYVWFIDDDDYLEDNMHEVLESALRFRPSKPITVVGVKQVIENAGRSFGKPGFYYSPNNILKSFSFSNETPFPAVIFPRSSLRNFQNLLFEQMSFQEDHWLIISALAESNLAPTLVDLPVVKASIRTSSNSSSRILKSQKSDARSRISWMWANTPTSSQFGLQLASRATRVRTSNVFLIIRVIKAIFSPSLWRGIAALRVLSRLLGREITLGELKEGIRKLG